MKMNRRNILVTLAVMLSALVCRADGITDLFVPVFSGVTHKVKHGIIKGQKLKGEVLDELNYQFLRRLEKEGLITLKQLYIDGTKIEANANRYTFVWRGTLNYHLAGLLDTTDAL